MPLLAGLAELLGPLLAWVLRILVVSLVARVLVGFGLSVVTYKFVFAPILAGIRQQAVGLPAELVNWLGLLRFDVALSIVLSAYAIRFGLQAVHLVKS